MNCCGNNDQRDNAKQQCGGEFATVHGIWINRSGGGQKGQGLSRDFLPAPVNKFRALKRGKMRSLATGQNDNNAL
jgi:hypothetical protein